MSGVNIDYTIINKDKYSLDTGKIDSIYAKNSPGFSVTVPGSFTFEVRLKTKSIIHVIEIKPSHAEKVII